LWEVNVGAGYSAVSVVGKRLYTMGNCNDKDTVFCLDAETGKEIWRYSYSCGKGGSYAGSRATPVISNNLVFTFSNEGLLNCIDAETGKKRWSKSVAKEGAANLKWKYSGSPLVTDGLVIVNAGKSGMAFELKSGKEVWKSSGVGGYATPVFFMHNNKKYVLLFGEKALYVVNLKDGRVVASTAWKTKYDVNAADPIVLGDKIFISSGYDHGCALFEFNNRKLKQVWFNKRMRSQFATPVLYDGVLYGSDGKTGKGDLVAVSIKDGREKWRQSKLGYGSLIIADSRIIYLTDKGKLIIGKVSSSSFKPEISQYVLTKAGKCWTMPVLSNKRLYCRGGNGKLICIDMK